MPDGLDEYAHVVAGALFLKAIAAELPSFPPPYADPLATLPRIAGLALAHPDTSYTQEQVLERLGLADDEFARRIFGRCGVQRRRLRLDDEFLDATVQARTPAIEQMLLDEATRAVDELAIDPAEIGVVVTSSLYTLAGPTLAHRLVEHYAMDPATDKYHVVGVGCASAVPLVRLAGQTLAGRVGGVGGPQKKALVLAAESMSGIISRARKDDERSKTVGSSIFGDGCAAALIELGEETDGDSSALDGLAGPAVVASKVHQVVGTLDAVRMQLESDDSYLHLIRELPDVAAEGLGELADEFLAANGLEREDVDRWLLHPGGRRIIESLQGALGLTREQAQSSFDVLAEHGNIGTPAIFYVLKRSLEQRPARAGEHALMVTVGPGVTVGLMLLRW
ncbi:MAG TPA: 3-oxoacyl-[acyl-carrier-protein] synthase III C-terminal domain-containing protein [Solirubrobacteraceae bacterium]|nr:3-oxoacyl-[acyl-carrier-protein] synthase III C-terminal domain-containing protein [Solirubrobacteraceae bacterium]